MCYFVEKLSSKVCVPCSYCIARWSVLPARRLVRTDELGSVFLVFVGASRLFSVLLGY